MKTCKDGALILILMLISAVPRFVDLGAFTPYNSTPWIQTSVNC